jgi:phage shock protein E
MNRTILMLAVLAVVGVGAYLMLTGGRSVPVEDTVGAIARGSTVVDVRTADEYAAGHILGALHADVLGDQFEQRMAALDPTEPVYLYCASGVRSGRAAAVLEGMGFTYVVNAGGFDDLVAAGAPVGP